MDERLIAELRSRIVRFFGRRLEGTGCVYEMANEIRVDGWSNDAKLGLIQEAVEALLTAGTIRRVVIDDGRVYTGYNIPYELT